LPGFFFRNEKETSAGHWEARGSLAEARGSLFEASSSLAAFAKGAGHWEARGSLASFAPSAPSARSLEEARGSLAEARAIGEARVVV
jgi:hypothetical protein